MLEKQKETKTKKDFKRCITINSIKNCQLQPD